MSGKEINYSMMDIDTTTEMINDMCSNKEINPNDYKEHIKTILQSNLTSKEIAEGNEFINRSRINNSNNTYSRIENSNENLSGINYSREKANFFASQ